MSTDLLSDLERLRDDTSLSEHRLGILVAGNGRLFERVRAGGRMWPETVAKVRRGIAKVRADREAGPAAGDAA